MDTTSLGKPHPESPVEQLGQTIGTDRPGEISDFVANSGSKRYYLQFAFNLATPEKDA